MHSNESISTFTVEPCQVVTLIGRAKQTEPRHKVEACMKYKLLRLYHMYTFPKLHRDEGSCAMCHRAPSGEVRGWIRHFKSGTNYTPAASSGLREFRIGSCEKSPATQTPKPELFQEDLVVKPPQVERMGELANQRPFFSWILNVGRLYRRAGITFVRSW